MVPTNWYPRPHSPDEALRFPVVAKRPTTRLDPAGQRGLADEPAAPHRVEQLLLGDEPVVIADQLRQDVEQLRLDPNHLVVAPVWPSPPAAVGVDSGVGRGIHVPISGFACWPA
jgi:hypothetical protein